jgi:hypothetical protein
MRIRATLIDSIASAATTVDGLHLALSLRDVDAQEFTLGIPIAQVAQLIELSARTLADCAREGQDIESKLIGTNGRFSVMGWNLARTADDGLVVVFTLESGGTLAFDLSQQMAVAMLATLDSYNESRGDQRGFGE